MIGRAVLKVTGVALLLTLGACGEASQSTTPYPVDQGRVLAVDTSGGWVNVDFLVQDRALAEARRCVRSRPRAEAVSCYGFASREAYSAAKPIAAGNYTNLCWEGRWNRNKLGDESGDTLSSFQKADVCPGG